VYQEIPGRANCCKDLLECWIARGVARRSMIDD
jgi:hypothetical protein